MNDILIIVLRSATVYICILLLIRIFGKKEISQLSVVDLVFILLISNSVQNAMVGSNSSLEGGLIAAATLFALNALFRNLIFKYKPFRKLIVGEPVILVYEGKINMKNLQQEKITEDELNASIHEHGISDLAEVNLAVLETDGNISVLSDNYKKRTVKRGKHNKDLKQDLD
jgi:uncharacterized membrane protein YcaP (DUF421 family)